MTKNQVVYRLHLNTSRCEERLWYPICARPYFSRPHKKKNSGLAMRDYSVGTIFPILSLNLVSQAHYSNTLPGRSNVHQNTLGRYYCDFMPDLTRDYSKAT